MAYRIDFDDPLGPEVKRIAAEQLDKALEETRNAEVSESEKVHQIRKRMKKLRGLLRLARPALDGVYGDENAAFRDLARRLSEGRDAEVLAATLDKVREEAPEAFESPAGQETCFALAGARDAFYRAGTVDRKLEAALDELRQARQRVDDWTLSGDRPKKLLVGALKTYKRSRKAMRQAYADPTPERFHEWRKRVKYHWYHVRLLEELWSGPFKTLAKEAKTLSDYLGDDHDLATLRGRIEEIRERAGELAGFEELLAAVDAHRKKLQKKARKLGRRLLAEKPKQLEDRWARYLRLAT